MTISSPTVGGSLPATVPLVLDATDVSVSFRAARGRATVVDSIGLGLERSQVTVLLGESGSGKTPSPGPSRAWLLGPPG